ncbi:MAG: hypothetical protein WBD06_20085, partial [Acidobacteriaceae bacterium]
MTKQDCENGRNDAFDTLNRDQSEYDKQLLALSAGFLGVSLAFVKDVVPLKVAVHLRVFDWALFLLFGCICFVLGTFQYGVHSQLSLAEYWRLMGESCDAKDEEKTAIAKDLETRWIRLKHKHDVVKVLNWIAGVLFGVGVALLVLFVITNIHREAHLGHADVGASGYNSSQPHP